MKHVFCTKIIKFCLFLAIFSASSTVFALNLELFRPVGDNLGTIRLQGTKTLDQTQFSLGVFESYLSEPLAIKGYPTPPTKRNVVDRMITTDITGDIGINDWISLGFVVPLISAKTVNPSTIATTPSYASHFAAGDIEIHAKFNPIKLEDYPLGAALVPFIVVPSGSEKYYTGDKGVSGGVKLVGDWEYSRFYLNATVGFNARSTEKLTYPGTTGSLRVSNEFLFGVGGRVDLIENTLQLTADVTGSTPFGQFAEYERSSPVDAMAGVRYFLFNRMLGLHIGGGSGLNHGYGAAQYRVYGGITLQYPETKYRAHTQMPKIITEEKERVIVFKGVYFETASAKIKPESLAVLDENVKMMKQNPDLEARIEGHTDSRGSDVLNMKLSQERANAVMKYFVDHGVSADRLAAIGRGETKPVVPNTSADNMAKNRRIEMHIKVKNTIQKVVN